MPRLDGPPVYPRTMGLQRLTDALTQRPPRTTRLLPHRRQRRNHYLEVTSLKLPSSDLLVMLLMQNRPDGDEESTSLSQVLGMSVRLRR